MQACMSCSVMESCMSCNVMQACMSCSGMQSCHASHAIMSCISCSVMHVMHVMQCHASMHVMQRHAIMTCINACHAVSCNHVMQSCHASMHVMECHAITHVMHATSMHSPQIPAGNLSMTCAASPCELFASMYCKQNSSSHSPIHWKLLTAKLFVLTCNTCRKIAHMHLQHMSLTRLTTGQPWKSSQTRRSPAGLQTSKDLW